MAKFLLSFWTKLILNMCNIKRLVMVINILKTMLIM